MGKRYKWVIHKTRNTWPINIKICTISLVIREKCPLKFKHSLVYIQHPGKKFLNRLSVDKDEQQELPQEAL